MHRIDYLFKNLITYVLQERQLKVERLKSGATPGGIKSIKHHKWVEQELPLNKNCGRLELQVELALHARLVRQGEALPDKSYIVRLTRLRGLEALHS